MIIPTKLKIRGAYLIACLINAIRKLFGLGACAKVRRRGVNWSLDLREGIDFAIYLTGSFEPNTIAAYKKILKNGDVALDIGANIGAHTLHLAAAVGASGHVYALEPTADIYLKLKDNLHQNPDLKDRVEAHQVMLMAENDLDLPTEIYASWPLKGSNKAHALHGGVGISTEGATIKSLDSMIEDLKLEKVTLIKMDVDGYEMDVLSGAVETIRRFRPVVIFEHSPYTSEERILDPNKIIKFFKSLNYSFYDLSGNSLTGTQGCLPEIGPGSGINILARMHD